jgi:hypothetical protein
MSASITFRVQTINLVLHTKGWRCTFDIFGYHDCCTKLLIVTSNCSCPFVLLRFHGLVDLQLIGTLRLQGRSLRIRSAHLSLCCYRPGLGGLGTEKAPVCAAATVSRQWFRAVPRAMEDYPKEFLLALNQDGLY